MTTDTRETMRAELLRANVREELYAVARRVGFTGYAAAGMTKDLLVNELLDRAAPDELRQHLDAIRGRDTKGDAARGAVPTSNGCTVPASGLGAIGDIIDAAIRDALRSGAAVDRDTVRAIVQEEAAKAAEVLRKAMEGQTRRVTIVQPETGEEKDLGTQHERFPTLLAFVNAREDIGGKLGHRTNVWLHGPKGTGKTTAARNVAEALGMGFAFTGALDAQYGLTGFIDGGGRLVRTPFRDRWEHGGVFLFDEIDGSAAEVVNMFNAALANGLMAFPDAIVPRHDDCVIIAGANSTGGGGTMQYAGRTRQDGAAVDRFAFLAWPIDEALEAAMSTDSRWLAAVRASRKLAIERGLEGCSPRAVVKGQSLLRVGVPVDVVAEACLLDPLAPPETSKALVQAGVRAFNEANR